MNETNLSNVGTMDATNVGMNAGTDLVPANVGTDVAQVPAESSNLSTGAKIGIGAGVVCVVGLIGFGIYKLVKKHKTKKAAEEQKTELMIEDK